MTTAWKKVKRTGSRFALTLARAAFGRRTPKNATWWDLLAALLRRFSFPGLASVPVTDVRSKAPLLAYYQPSYPTLSETFVRREVKALRQAGVLLRIFALHRGDADRLEAEASDGVTWFGPADAAIGRRFLLDVFRVEPWLVVRLGCWIVRSGRHSWSGRDLDVFYQAGHLAMAMQRSKVTHVHSPWADRHALVAFVAARLIGATFSVQARASDVHRVISGHGLADRVRFAEFIVTNSAYNERHLRSVLGKQAPPIHVIRNGLDLSPWFSANRARRDDRSPFHLLAVGRLVEPKGFKYLLQACRLLLDRGHEITCEIVGGRIDPLDTVTWIELQLLHEELKLGAHVEFAGPRPFADVYEAYQRADVFVLPCIRGRDGSHDITPNSLIEAMAMKLPVVSTTSGAIPEIVDDQVDGLLVAPETAGALADAIERLLSDADLRVRLGEAARRKVESRFDANKNARDRVRLLQSLRSPVFRHAIRQTPPH